MSDLFPAYCELISSAAQLKRCQEATSVSELLAIIKVLWQQTTLSDDQLIAGLAQLNQQIIDVDKIQLAGTWLPYRYHAKTRSIYWCLPAGHATEPFQDETISRYRQTILVNQFIAPKTALSSLDVQARSVRSITPAGFIFHLSRCGSTLVSGCLSELDSTCVLSESPVLTDILLDQTLGETAQQKTLQQLIDLQASVFPARPDVVIKWNAWDIFHWDLIRAIYPQVPVIFLVRNPVEVLASHQRSAGRHMSGDPDMAGINPVFSTCGHSLLMWRSSVVAALLGEMKAIIPNPLVLCVDYGSLDANHIQKIGHHFSLYVDDEAFQKMIRRLQFHSKTPGIVFVNDISTKQTLFTDEDKTRIQRVLMPAYMQILQGDW